jgi:hypothetical protein
MLLDTFGGDHVARDRKYQFPSHIPDYFLAQRVLGETVTA